MLNWEYRAEPPLRDPEFLSGSVINYCFGLKKIRSLLNKVTLSSHQV